MGPRLLDQKKARWLSIGNLLFPVFLCPVVVWLQWHWRTARQAVSQWARSTASWRSTFPTSGYAYAWSRTSQILCSWLISLTSFCIFQTAPDGWKNSVRHNLSLNKCFEKVENKMSGTSRKGCLWALNPAKIDKMEEEMQKWKRKDLAAIHRSMANPGRAYITLLLCVWEARGKNGYLARNAWILRNKLYGTELASAELSHLATASSSELLSWNTPCSALNEVIAAALRLYDRAIHYSGRT